MQAGRSKLARLQKWGDAEEDGRFDDVVFPSRKPTRDPDDILPENIDTLRLSPPRAGLSSPAFHITDPRPARLAPLDHLTELDKDDFSFGDDGLSTCTHEWLQKLFDNRKVLPGSFASLSPTRLKSPSEYDDDTDITEINDNDFEGIDDIFGKEESRVLSSTAHSYTAPNISRANITLSRRKEDLQRAAELEDREMRTRYQQKYGDTRTLTLNLRDQQQFLARQRKKLTITMDAQYIDDDPFEEGLDEFSPEILAAPRLKQRQRTQTEPVRALLGHKVSLPSLQQLFAPRDASGPKKFRSTMDLASAIQLGAVEDQHPTFNDNNRLIKKLGRMPSFHFANKASERRPERVDEGLERENRLQDMEKRKAALLEKYRELQEKQAVLRMSPTKVAGQKMRKPRARRSVGLVKNLNGKAEPASYAATGQGMQYNATTRTWEGNEHDLLRFDDEQEPACARKPSLITSRDFGLRKATRHGNMMYDAENLRWVNMDAVAEETGNGLDKLPDLVPNDIPQYALPRSTSRRALGERGASHFTQRTVLTASSGSSARSAPIGDQFYIGEKLAARFEREESKIRRKTKEWFSPHDKYNPKHTGPFNHEYFWEIRKMVMGTYEGN
ncbi:hypothetical protein METBISCDRAFT_25742 [Metschnikowia bicuspidata]|uniref:Uncharacterized protein n=1 Tax=Metschnikowia bicuspidata TaxID=27322 RepID=A0A4P9ZJE5_9ASCO|nr:hypothetical protein METBISCDRAFT_25742 [Metschnikowia bicuspidata]